MTAPQKVSLFIRNSANVSLVAICAAWNAGCLGRDMCSRPRTEQLVQGAAGLVEQLPGGALDEVEQCLTGSLRWSK